MDFNPTREQKELKRTIKRFVQEQLNDGSALARDESQTFSRELWRKCGEMGLPGLVVPTKYGGAGLDALSAIIAFEALGLYCNDGGLVFSLGAHLFSCVVPIWKSGNEEQRRRYLPGLSDGSLIAVNGMTEPSSGSDAFSMKMRAVRDGAGYRITGSKTFSTNGPIGDLYVVFAVTDPDKGYHGGITTFLVDADTKGVTATRSMSKMGLRTSPMGELVFDEAYVPASAVLGVEGAGSAEFTRSMDWERVGIFASHVGQIERLLKRAVDHARSRSQFGNKIGKYQAISHRVADMRIKLEAARLLTYRAAWRLSQGRNATLEASMTKVFVSEALIQSALDTVQIMGAYGYMSESGVERVLRDSVASTIYSGTSEIQRNIIARWLGL
ncbi:MAG: acyl-CoA dehydrogenase family protein [Myxococcales bacterium]|nr:acyl-CoA dehydrogenase family protein [Myxococcales bacterium]MCA9714512.1 acyl-CoA dehydrogenase family protein [Myxococcales bacterium]MCB9752613.1 acyl-CoA dehydrogenase family protein [Myxococcales bacterium]